ncbi:glycerol-3-phosphate acyltransferase [Lampropedia cohaerens]|uniref:Glycerol-3-phosphate acyltransferase n=1 Tax=Lampropedia cohaerens TaxID=1610491 RepID=A0A0U1Q263_9BURK|nr:glycerol-3-phosphate 1-O-acyltransferase PlsY [Lampropedia cohaerens]KKW68842.1 glycerol-3-phosphate acyltransferase [Lampropedia cohaerens]
MEAWILIPVLAGAYLLGSVPFAVVVSRIMGLQDPRSFGSGNPGATNVLRSGSKAAAVLTLVLDAAKGWLPVALVGWYGAAYGLYEGAQAAVGFAAFLGHVFSVFLRFKGGKGVATALGVLLGIQPWLGLAVLVVWLLAVGVWRMSSLASLVAAVAAPVIYLLGGGSVWVYDRPVLLFTGLMSVVLIYRHAPNISRLLAGTEPRLGASGRAAPKPAGKSRARRRKA